MGRPNKIQLTEELEKEVIEFYLAPNSAREVERAFGLNLYQLNKVLTKHDIAFHSQETVQNVKNKQLEKTLLERYGVSSTFKSDEILQKCKQTNLERYGFDYAIQSVAVQQKAKETCIKNHNGRTDVGQFGSVEHKKWAADKKYLEKSKQTCLERYGVEYPNQSVEIRQKTITTNLNKYGVDNPLKCAEIRKNKLNTQKKNNTYNTSSEELCFSSYLNWQYNTVYCQYMCEKYPFCCDFYIPSEDLFIELNLSWTHGKHPFDENNPDDIALLEKWKEKAKTSKYYKNAIETWTVRDIKKLKTAKENNLNYKAIYIDEWNQMKKEIKVNE